MSVEPDPTVQWRLGRLLRAARTEIDQTQKQVAAAMDWHPSKVRRIENGDVSVSTTDLKALLDHYGIRSEQEIEPLLSMGQAVRSQVYRQSRDVLAAGFAEYLEAEGSALTLRAFETTLVPGLLQTEAYAGEVIRAYSRLVPEDVERRIEVRMERQKLLGAPHAPAMTFILDEAVLWRRVGGDDVMREQLAHLQEVRRLPNVSVRILPFERGLYAAHRGAFVLLDFPPGANGESLLYRESPLGDGSTRDPALVARYAEDFELLATDALSESDSADLLAGA